MLKRKALRKMLITTITVFILLVVYLIPVKEQTKELETNLEIEYITGLGTNYIYLFNHNNYLVRAKILLTSDKQLDQVAQLIDNLTGDASNQLPTGLYTVIPNDVKVLNIEEKDKIVTIDFSKEFLNIDEKIEEKVVESLVYSILDLGNIDGVKILVEGEPLLQLPHSKAKLPEVLTKKIGINKVYDLQNRTDINKVVIYYLEEFEGNQYYVPVTKYVNDKRDKIKIIVDNLTSAYIYEPNLMSFLNQDTELLDYRIEDNLMILNFNDSIFTDESQILEEVVYSLAYSVFDNYDVNEVVLQVNNQEIVKKTINTLE